MQNQNDIRQHIQTIRKGLSQQQQTVYSAHICQQVANSHLLNDVEHIAIYLPVQGEADPTPLLDIYQHQNKQFYLPVLSPSQQNHLAFAEYNIGTPMKLNRFKISEPDVTDKELLNDPMKLDCVIMPLVAIDPMGNRIGMGGGFYDRTFSFRKESKAKPLLIGFCYDFQIIAPQTPQDWDVPADAIASQSGCQLL